MKKIIFYIIGTISAATLFFGVIEITTRTISFFSGRGFRLALHEFQATDPAITKIYQWHPFTGFTLTPNYKFRAGHPNQRAKALIKTVFFPIHATTNLLNQLTNSVLQPLAHQPRQIFTWPMK